MMNIVLEARPVDPVDSSHGGGISVDWWLLKLFESHRGSDPALQTARPQSTEHFPRLFPRMGAGRVRFFSADIRDRADGA